MESLRERRCRLCLLLFFICRWCDRGQAYCRDACREKARRKSARAARVRHARSEEGRLDHRDHQAAYRARLRRKLLELREERSRRDKEIEAPCTTPASEAQPHERNGSPGSPGTGGDVSGISDRAEIAERVMDHASPAGEPGNTLPAATRAPDMGSGDETSREVAHGSHRSSVLLANRPQRPVLRVPCCAVCGRTSDFVSPLHPRATRRQRR